MTEQNIKLLTPLRDGLAVEAVFYGSGTLCVSSQVGCPLGCPFCASGQLPFLRNLDVGELEQQVDLARRLGLEPRRVTVSGIGEPLLNAGPVAEFLEACRRRSLPVSLTTVGRPLPELGRFLALPHNGLMVSVHAGSAAVHRRLLPHGPDLAALWEQLELVWPGLSRRQRRKIGINYLLLAGINDSAEERSALTARLRPFPEMTVHLLSCNAVPGSSFRGADERILGHWHRTLREAGINVRRANRWRRRLEGGCGTLAAQMPAANLKPAAQVYNG